MNIGESIEALRESLPLIEYNIQQWNTFHNKNIDVLSKREKTRVNIIIKNFKEIKRRIEEEDDLFSDSYKDLMLETTAMLEAIVKEYDQ